MRPASGSYPSAKERLPKAIAHYAVEDRVGKGAMAVVYRATDERDGRTVALKVMATDLEGDAETRERFFREASVARQLRHPNVVTILESGEDAGRLFIAMELLSGCTLTEFLKRPEAADLEARLDVMIQVCQGLKAAHEAGIYHRDVKPANLFVCEDNRVKILDFGVARLAGSNMTVTGYILGTPDFMSPEQARGNEIDQRSDIFSAAGVFYLMLTGRKPFAAPDLPAVLNNVLRTDPLPIRTDEAPETVAAIIHRGLSKDPAGRQQTVAQLMSELMAASAARTAATRQIALGIRESAEELLRLTARRQELSVSLGLPDSPEPEPWRALIDRYPVLRRGPSAIGGFPLRGTLVNRIGLEIREELGPLRQDVSTLESGHAEWQQAVKLVGESSHDAAVARFAAARRMVPASPVIARDAASCAEAIERRREHDALLQSRHKLAEEAAARQDWQALIAIASEIDEVDPGNAEARRLRDQAQRNLEAAKERQTRERAQRMAAAAVNEARLAADDGRFDEGLASLEAYLASRPDAPGVADAIDELRRQQQSTRVRAERLAQAARLIDEARQRFEAGDYAGADRSASQAVALNAEDRDARHLLERVRTAIKLQREREERERRIADLLTRARQLAERKQFVKAMAALDEAIAVDAARVEVSELRTRVAADQAAEKAAEEAAALSQRRSRAAAPALREAQKAFAAGNVVRARWAAENALAQSPGAPEILALLKEIETATPQPTDDDTAILDAPEPDEGTKRLAPANALQDVAQDLRDRAATMLKRWQSRKL